MNCENHHDRPATHRCATCRKAWCKPCLRPDPQSPNVLLCPNCGRIISKREPASTRPGDDRTGSFADDFRDAFTYPFGGPGIVVILIATIGSTVGELFWPISLVVTGLVMHYFQYVVANSAAGYQALPDFPDEWLVQSVTQVFRLVGFSVIAVVPTFIVVLLMPVGFSVNTEVATIALGVLAFEAFYISIAWLGISVSSSFWRGINPLNVLQVYRAAPLQAFATGAWFAVVLVVAAPLAVWFAMNYAESGWYFPGSFVLKIVAVYFVFVGMRVLGLLYYHNRDELEGFAEGG